MEPKTLQALQESIKHWERVVADPLHEETGVHHCALCKLFYPNNQESPMEAFLNDPCKGCPIKEKTGAPFCEGTPYDRVAHLGLHEKEGTDEYKEAAQEELDFLRSLLPVEVNG